MHKQFEESAVGGSEQVNQLMHDHKLPQVFGHGQEHGVECEQSEGVITVQGMRILLKLTISSVWMSNNNIAEHFRTP